MLKGRRNRHVLDMEAFDGDGSNAPDPMASTSISLDPSSAVSTARLAMGARGMMRDDRSDDPRGEGRRSQDEDLEEERVRGVSAGSAHPSAKDRLHAALSEATAMVKRGAAEMRSEMGRGGFLPLQVVRSK